MMLGSKGQIDFYCFGMEVLQYTDCIGVLVFGKFEFKEAFVKDSMLFICPVSCNVRD